MGGGYKGVCLEKYKGDYMGKATDEEMREFWETLIAAMGNDPSIIMVACGSLK